MTIILTPAYGRDYKSKKAILEDLNGGKDFVVQPVGCYANAQDLATEGDKQINVRYKAMRQVAVFTCGNDGVWK